MDSLENKRAQKVLTTLRLRALFVINLTSGEEEGLFFSLDTRFRESSELELCPSAADSLELEAGTEFFLASFLLLKEREEEDADE